MDYDHDAVTHEMTCPMGGCNYHMEAHAHDDDEAAMKFMEAGKAHMMEVHADAPVMEDGAMKQMVRGAMTKKGGEYVPINGKSWLKEIRLRRIR